VEQLGTLRDPLAWRALPPGPLRCRARHLLAERARVEAGVAAARHGDAETIGRLLRSTQESLRVDFEVSCAEIDRLMARAERLPGWLGGRLMGGGFGGVTIHLLREKAAPLFLQEMGGGWVLRTVGGARPLA
jgi:galactokinase